MPHLLLIVTLITGPIPVSGVEAIEFNSLEACQEARAMVQSLLEAQHNDQATQARQEREGSGLTLVSSWFRSRVAVCVRK